MDIISYKCSTDSELGDGCPNLKILGQHVRTTKLWNIQCTKHIGSIGLTPRPIDPLA